MAKTYSNLSKEERKHLILMIADYIIESKCSLRKASEYSKTTEYPLSIFTISEMMNKELPKINEEKYEKVMNIMKKNTPQTIKDERVIERMAKAVYLIYQNYTVSQIADILHSTYDIIYDDLTSRLPKYKPLEAKLVAEKLKLQRTKNFNRSKESQNEEVDISIDINNISLKFLTEIALMALTFRISENNLANLLNVTKNDINKAFAKLINLSQTLYYLKIETDNEDIKSEQLAYFNGYNYLKKRKQIEKKLNIAKQNKDEKERIKIQIELKEHISLVDDAIVLKTINKKIQDLTEIEKRALGKFRLKYALYFNKASIKVKRSPNILEKLEQKIAEEDEIFKFKIEKLNNFLEIKRNDIIYNNNDNANSNFSYFYKTGR